MDITDLFLILFYGVAVVFIIIFLSSYLQKSTPPQIIVIDKQPDVTSWWPWHITSYNAFPYWTGWWSRGYNGGYSPKYYKYPSHHTLRPISTRPYAGHGRHANTGGFYTSTTH